MVLFYGYEDWTTEETPRCFYVGIGNLARTKRLDRNNKHSGVSKHFGQERLIVCQFNSWEAAKYWETENILTMDTFTISYDRNEFIGCNFTYGGDGQVGRKCSEETKKKMSDAKFEYSHIRGKKMSDEQKQKISIAHKDKSKPWIAKFNQSRIGQGWKLVNGKRVWYKKEII